MMKKCSKCKEVKPYSDFGKQKTGKDGFRSSCKYCQKQYREENKEKIKQWRKENKEKIKQYYKENKEKIKQYYKENKEKINQYRKENKEKRNQQAKQWRKENKEKINQYREENKEKIKQQTKQYYKENKEKIKQQTKQYFKQRRKTDPIFRLTLNTRSLIRTSLSNKGYSKNTNTHKILGLEYEDFYTWLSTEASNGLNFDADDVHVDHVIPVSFAKTEEQVLSLNHYSNLQLLTSEENLNKHNTYIKQSNLDRVMKHHPDYSMLTKILLNYDYLIF
jgi:hypothetical protein